MIYVKDKHGKQHTIDIYTKIYIKDNEYYTGYIDVSRENAVIDCFIDNWKHCQLKVYYRHEKTWNDHMGNTPCGYYVNVPINKNEKKRVYIHCNGWQ